MAISRILAGLEYWSSESVALLNRVSSQIVTRKTLDFLMALAQDEDITDFLKKEESEEAAVVEEQAEESPAGKEETDEPTVEEEQVEESPAEKEEEDTPDSKEDKPEEDDQE